MFTYFSGCFCGENCTRHVISWLLSEMEVNRGIKTSRVFICESEHQPQYLLSSDIKCSKSKYVMWL